MKRYVAFLRGINLGKRRLAMSRLKELFEELSFEDVATFIASGNVIFSCKKSLPGKLEDRIADHLEKALGYPVDTFVRTTEEVAGLTAAADTHVRANDSATVHVGFLHRTLSADIERRFASIRTEHDAFKLLGREFFWICNIRTSDSKVWTLPELKSLRLPTMTLRNMKSIRKLIAKHID